VKGHRGRVVEHRRRRGGRMDRRVYLRSSGHCVVKSGGGGGGVGGEESGGKSEGTIKEGKKGEKKEIPYMLGKMKTINGLIRRTANRKSVSAPHKRSHEAKPSLPSAKPTLQGPDPTVHATHPPQTAQQLPPVLTVKGIRERTQEGVPKFRIRSLHLMIAPLQSYLTSEFFLLKQTRFRTSSPPCSVACHQTFLFLNVLFF